MREIKRKKRRATCPYCKRQNDMTCKDTAKHTTCIHLYEMIQGKPNTFYFLPSNVEAGALDIAEKINPSRYTIKSRIYVGRIETRHFSFESYAESQAGAYHLLKHAWIEHRKQSGAVLTFEELWKGGDAYVEPVEIGHAYRDHQLLI